MTTTITIDPKNPADAEALRVELLKVFPDCARYLRPAVDHWGKPFGDSHAWQSPDGSCGCWFGTCQSAWTNDSWGWQSAEPNAVQKRVMKCVPCVLGGWFFFDVASIGD